MRPAGGGGSEKPLEAFEGADVSTVAGGFPGARHLLAPPGVRLCGRSPATGFAGGVCVALSPRVALVDTCLRFRKHAHRLVNLSATQVYCGERSLQSAVKFES